MLLNIMLFSVYSNQEAMSEGEEAAQQVSSTIATEHSKEQKVTPWEAHAAEGENTIDYGKLIRKSNFAVLVHGSNKYVT